MLKWLLIFFILFISGFVVPCRAQYRIPLDSVAKITFIQSSSLFGNSLKVEVVPEMDLWKAFQTELHREYPQTDDLKRIFLKDIPVSYIAELLKITADDNTTVNYGLYEINRQQIIDTLPIRYPTLSSRQKAEFITAIETDRIFYKYVDYVVKNPFFYEYPDHYQIIIQTLNGRVDSIDAHAHSANHIFPWVFNKRKHYHPNITRIYQSVVGNKQDPLFIHMFNRNLLFEMYVQRYQLKFNWEEIKDNYPALYKLLNKNIKPILIGASVMYKAAAGINKGYNVTGTVKRLPVNVKLKFSVGGLHAESQQMVAKYLDTLRGVFGRKNFLFDYLKKRPDASILFEPQNKIQFGERAYQSIKPYFPNIDKYHHREIQIIKVKGKPDIESTWLLLPDNTLLLCSFLPQSYTYPKDWMPQFMGLDKELVCFHYPNSGYVCIHLDAKGKLIRDYGPAPNISFSNL